MSKSKTILLGDGDVFAYNAAASVETEVDWGDGLWTLHSYFDEAVKHAMSHIAAVLKETKADEFIFVWSCPTRHYWRHDVMPSYKGGRRKLTSRSPLALSALKLYLAEQFESHMKPTLEGDDVLGILATAPWYRPDDEKIIVSIDKDMKTIPSMIYNPDKDYQPWQQTAQEAELYFLSQAIGGDTTDGYGGCPGIGTDSATAFLDEPFRWEQYDHTFKSGPRKNTTEKRWRKEASINLYDSIITLFMKGGDMTYEEAEVAFITNARCARILHNKEYDWEKEEVKLWVPTKEMLTCT